MLLVVVVCVKVCVVDRVEALVKRVVKVGHAVDDVAIHIASVSSSGSGGGTVEAIGVLVVVMVMIATAAASLGEPILTFLGFEILRSITHTRF